MLLSLGLMGSVFATGPDTTPPGPPTQFTATASGNTVVLTWTNPTDDDFASTTIRVSTTNYPQTIASGNVVSQNITGTSITLSSVPDGLYYYAIFASDVTGNISVPATQSATVDTTAPGKVFSLFSIVSGNVVQLIWVPPLDPDFSGIVVRRANDVYPTTPTQGVSITLNGTTATMEEAVPDGTYYYSIFAYDTVGNIGAPATINISIDITAPDKVSNLISIVSGNSVELIWVPPVDFSLEGIVVRRSTTDFPIDITQGTGVSLNGLTATVATTLPDDTYYFSVFAYDTVGHIGAPATLNVTLDTGASAQGSAGRPLNVPNPFKFSSGTFIGYWLNQEADMDLRVYTSWGTEIYRKTFKSGVDEGGKQGYNRVVINKAVIGEGWASGVYMYVLLNNGKVLGKGKFAVLPE